MQPTIFALVGPSGCGKTTFITEMLRRHAGFLTEVQSVTTRERRTNDRDASYAFLTRADFERALSCGEIVLDMTYGGNRYGIRRSELDRLVVHGAGLMALTEESVLRYRMNGIYIVAIRLQPEGMPDHRDNARRMQDTQRAMMPISEALVLQNRWNRDGGPDPRILERLSTFITSTWEVLTRTR